MRVLGIDPGSRRTGFAVLQSESGSTQIISSGVIALDEKLALPHRLAQLAQDLRDLIRLHRPAEVALESVFFARNAQSALKLGHARGVILMIASEHRLPIHEYSPAEAKAVLTGRGRATKEEVARMVRILLKLPKQFEFTAADQSDALALGLVHVQSKRLRGNLSHDRSTFWQNSL